MARGMPSSRWHTCATDSAFRSVKLKSDLAAEARSTNKRMPSNCINKSISVIGCGLGNDKIGTDHTSSLSRPNDSRLVARIFKFGHRPSKVSARCAHPAIKCSQLSNTSSNCLERRKLESVWFQDWLGISRTPNDLAKACGTRASSVKG